MSNLQKLSISYYQTLETPPFRCYHADQAKRTADSLALNSSEIIPQLFEARTGKAFSLNATQELKRLLADFLEFQRVLSQNGEISVSPAAIRNWIIPRGNPPRISVPKRRDAFHFISNYIKWSYRSPNKNSEISQDIANRVLSHIDLLLEDRVSKINFDKSLSYHDSDFLFLQDDTVISVIRSIVFSSSKNPRSELDDLFRGRKGEEEDKSYYVMYRYSTNEGNIVKSLLQINTPEPHSDAFGFNHYIWCKRDRKSGEISTRGQHIYRECEGVVIKSDVSYYLLGHNFTVPVDRITMPDRYQVLREQRKERPNGIGLLAFEYESIRQSPGLLSGLTMTLAAYDQPVIARVALLYLGTASTLKIPINAELIVPGEIEPYELEENLRQMLIRVKRSGAREFSEYLENIVSIKNWGEKEVSIISRDILRLIDNVPAWSKRKRSSHSFQANGAIETIGLPVRPRD